MSYRHTSSASIALALAALLLAPVGSKAAPDVPTFAPAIWPEPAAADSFTRPRSALRIKPVQAGQPQPLFYAPSADSCSRAVRTHEEPGTQPAQLPRRIGSAALGAHAKYRARSADGAIALSAPAAPVAEAAELAAVAPAPAPAPAPIALIDSGVGRGKALQLAQEPVTAGMVDDNADFTQYLAFRDRTQVEHRPRDVRARVLLQVRDERGQAVPDAQVVVRASSGAAMWARTDAGGRAWIAPDAFDSQASQLYEVSVRQGQATAKAVFQRGQPSAVDVTLSAAAPAARARLDLVFMIDATGSMGDEIAKLKTSLRAIADEVARLPSRPDTCFGLVAYRDKTDAFVLRSHDFTSDLDAFQKVLNQLQADGGGDEPEAMNEALFEAVHALSWRGDGATRLLVLLADASPHLDYPGPQYDDSMMAALGKGIKVFSVGASGLNKQGEFIQRQIAQYTGGRFVFLTYAQASNPGSGPGRETVHDVSNYSVQTLDKLIVRLVSDELAQLPQAPRGAL